MEIRSTSFNQGQNIPTKYSCDGQGVNPPLIFDQIPKEAKSLVLVVGDPDAPSGTFTHWLLYNIDSQVKEIEEDSIPSKAIEGINSGNETGYYPPCPPAGSHRYFFRLYALDIELDLVSEITREELEKEMAGHILEQAELMGTYSR
jgi:Raf kinase inhibitor-like YbhB/YbcL family protein